MTFSLYWVGQPVAAALAAVVVYRVFNFAVPGVLALLVRQRVAPLLAAAEEGRVSTRWERRWAAAPLARLRRGRLARDAPRLSASGSAQGGRR